MSKDECAEDGTNRNAAKAGAICLSAAPLPCSAVVKWGENLGGCSNLWLLGAAGLGFPPPPGSALITSPEAHRDLFEPLRILYNPIVHIHFRATLS